MATSFQLDFSYAPIGPDQPNTTATHFDSFDIKLNLQHVLHRDHPEPADILFRSFQRTVCFDRRVLVSGDYATQGLLYSFFSCLTPDDDYFLRRLASDIVSLARDVDSEQVSHRYKAMELTVHVLFSTPYNEASEVDRAILQSAQELENRFTPASESAIKSLKRVRLNGTDEITDSPTRKPQSLEIWIDGCRICLEDISDADHGFLEMPCGHLYHEDCIVRWLQTSHFCPLCRYPLTVAGSSE